MDDAARLGIFKRFLVVGFCSISLALAACGYWFRLHQIEEIKKEKYDDLEAIAELKTRQIREWREERLADARLNARAFAAPAIAEWIESPEGALRDDILSHFERLSRFEGYANVALAAPDGRLLLSLDPRMEELDRNAVSIVARAVSARDAVSGDIVRCSACGGIHFDVAAPLLDGGGSPAAVLVLRADPDSGFFDLIQSWPTPSRTAETLIIEREGDAVLFLNRLRHGDRSPMTLRIPVSRTDVPAVRAALGMTGRFEGLDYRGVRVLADIRAIPDTPWFMVAKVDASEILAEAAYRGRVALLVTGLAILMTAAASSLLYHLRARRLHIALLRSERERRGAEEELRATLYGIGDGVIATDAEGFVSRMNPEAERLTGWSEIDARGKPLSSVFRIVNETTRGPVESPVDRVIREGVVVGLANHTMLVARDGTEHPIADSGAPVRNESGAVIGVVLVFRDRSREHRAEISLRREKTTAQMYLDVAGVMMLVLDPSGRVVLVNRKGCEILGRPESEIVGANWFDRFLPPGAREEVKSVFAGIVSGEAPREYAENAVLCGDGGEKIVAWHNAVLRDEAGRITGVLSSGEDVTERKRAERALESKTNELRAIIESAADGILVIDLDSRVMYSNSRFAAMWRIPAAIAASGDDRMLLRFVLDQLTDPEGFLAKVRALYDSDRTDLDTIRFKDGRVFERFSCPMSEGGRIVGRIWNFRDVTERERSTEALGKLHRLLEETQFLTKVGGWEYDAGTKRITWTDEVYRIYGVDRSYDPNDVGRDIGFYVPESAPAIERAFKRAIEAGEPYDLELEFVRADGERIWVRTVGRPVLEGGKVARVSGTFMDITERKRAEEGLRKLSLAVEQSPASVIITDVQGNIEYVNPKFTEITGYLFEDVRGKNPRILKSGETPAEGYRDLWATISSGREWRGEFHNKRKDGGLFWERAAISPIRDAAGAVTHYIGIKEDITAQKALEEQLRQSMKMESVGRLAGGVAHDFNNMLGVIIGNAEMALSGFDEESPLRSSLREILRAARRSAEFSRQLLAFARKQLVSPEVLDLNETIPGMLEMLRRLIGEDIELDWKPGPRLWPVKIDPAQIDQILVNLAVNARDAIAGVGKLAIETANASLDDEFCRMHPGFQSGEYVMLRVSDTGAGLDPETIEHIFEPFFTTKEVGKGTGLGLATVYGIVKQNNGSIDVRSERGAGTTFTVYLPRTRAVRQEQPAPAGEPATGVETVLVVEDEPAILKLAEKVLARYGYKVLAAKAPGAALDLVRDFGGGIHLLVTDVVMPGMNGRELRDEISRLKPGLKCLFMSGYTADVIAHQGLVEEGVNFLQKPFSVASLAKRVREALDGE